MLFSLRNVRKTRPSGYALQIRSLNIRRNAKVAITGPSGCGKSTTLDLLGLSLAPDNGESFVFKPQDTGVNVLELWQEHQFDALARLRLNRLGYVLQSGELLPFLTVGENMCLTGRLAGKKDTEDRARALASQLGIGRLWQAMPETLSVGERQRAAIVRALCARPQAILADEPTAALDSIHAAKVMEIFLACLEEYECALILVTHNPAWAASGGLEEIRFELREEGNCVTAIIDDQKQ